MPRTIVAVLVLVGCTKAPPGDNSPPGAPIVSIRPDGANTADDLVASVDTLSVDPDGDDVTYAFGWTVDGVAAEVHNSTVPAALTARDQRWEVTVTPNDGVVDGEAATASIIVANSLVDVSVGLSPSVVRTDDLVDALPEGEDPDGDALTWTFAWTVGGVAAGSDSTLAGTAFVAGDTVAVVVTATDPGGVAVSASASTIVANTAPSAPGVVIKPASPGDAADLVCAVSAAAIDADGDPISYTFAWDHDGTPYVGTTTVTAGDTVPAAATTAGQVWTCTVSAADAAESASGVASVTIDGVTSDIHWWFTCGDVVCRGYSGPFSGVPLCTDEAAGGVCDESGVSCDPENDCNALLTCASEDPAVDCPRSRKKWKHDIHYLSSEEQAALARDALRTRLATWSYNDDPDARPHLGFIIDDDPSAYAVNGDHVDVYGYTSLVMATVQAQEKRLADQEARLAAQAAEIEALRGEMRRVTPSR